MEDDYLMEREQLLDEIDQLKEKLTNAVSYQTDLERKNSESRLKINELVDNFETQGNDLEVLTERKIILEEEIKNVKKDLKKYVEDYNREREHIEKIQSQNMNLEQKCDELRKTNEKLVFDSENYRKQLASLKENMEHYLNDNKQLKFDLLRQAKKLKLIEDSKSKIIQEKINSEKACDQLEKRVIIVDRLRTETELEKLKLMSENKILTKDLTKKEKSLEAFESKINCSLKESEILKAKLIKALDVIKIRERVIELSNVKVKDLEKIVDTNKDDIRKQKKLINHLRKDKNNLTEEIILLKSEIDEAVKEMKLRQNDIIELKKKVEKSDNLLLQKQSLFEDIRMEKIQLEKYLQEANTENSELKAKLRVFNTQLDQLKEDITVKENALVKDEKLKRQLCKNEENLKITIQEGLDNVNKFKSEIEQIEFKKKQLLKQLEESDLMNQKNLVKLNQMIHEKELFNRKLVEGDEHNQKLCDKLRNMQIESDKIKFESRRLLKNIRRIQIENIHLRNENEALHKSADRVASFKQEIVHIQRDLVIANTKCQTLENDLTRPTNLHRWRDLESKNNRDLEKLRNYQYLQRRLIRTSSKLRAAKIRIDELEKENTIMKNTISEKMKNGSHNEFVRLQKLIKEKNEDSKILLTTLNVVEMDAIKSKQKEAQLQNFLQEIINQKHN